MASWNLWHGCHKHSAGCAHCYVYRGDAKRGVDTTNVFKTKMFDAPIKKKRNGEYKIPPGSVVYTCFSSDFFVEDADEWRKEAWEMIRTRSDLHFLMITKRIDRLHVNLPADWGDGYDNVTICCTVENQDRADYRLPIYKAASIKHKIIICEPIIDHIDLSHYLGDWVDEVVVGGESGAQARPCCYDWVLAIREECLKHKVSFTFRQTGSKLVKNGVLYKVARQFQHSQARKSGINLNF